MKKNLLIISSGLLATTALAASIFALSSKKESLAEAEPINYSLVIDSNSQIHDSSANHHALTTKGNRFNYSYGNTDYESDTLAENNMICMFRDNGSGFYSHTPIQYVKSVVIVFDAPGTLHLVLSATDGSFNGEDAYVASGVEFTPTKNNENVYVNIWSTLTTYVSSITINYTCE